MFTDSQLQQMQKHGVSVSQVQKQIANFEKGFPYLDIRKAATVDDGIMRLSDSEVQTYIEYYLKNLEAGKKVVKFVPASGAASRMFKSLFEFYNSYDNSEAAYQKMNANKKDDASIRFFKNIEKFAFFNDLEQIARSNGTTISESIEQRRFTQILHWLLSEDGLNYGNSPKGILKFHNYTQKARTPVEEHLVEAALYCASKDKAIVHFTVSPEHRKGFETLVLESKEHYEMQYGVQIAVEYSEQKPSTDTIAVDMNNLPFVEDDGKLLFRPAGHGALIENLNDLEADIIFVKNIDNVVPDHYKRTTVIYKQTIAGVLTQVQTRIFNYLKQLESNTGEALLEEIITFYNTTLSTDFGDVLKNKTIQDKKTILFNKLNRPIRVCGMVKNEGEPGGGPFWALNPDGTVSLQVVESAQIDPNNPEKQELLKQATHFNPVDLVCAVKDYNGNKFDLTKYTDPATGFISEKSKDGRSLKAQELPGLWNGAMSDWNTIFVEVPIITFNPVKVVNDLLRGEHQ